MATKTPNVVTDRVLGRRHPTFRLVPDGATGSRGEEAIELASAAGIKLDGFQQDWLTDGMALSGTRWASDEVLGVLSRQNGKSVVLVIRGLWGPTLGGEELVLFTSHQYKSAGEAFLLAKQICETSALVRFEPRVRAAHGAEGIEFNTGGRLLFIARSRVSGRGFSPNTVILDEAFELNDLQLSALKPALAAAKQPQAWYASSAPHPESSVLRRLARKGRSGDAKRLTYLEWSAPNDLPASDIRAWQHANPALGTRISLETVAAELESLTEEDFDRERLTRWDEGATLGPFPEWDSLAVLNPPSPTGKRAIAIDVAPDRRRASIAAAAELGGEQILVEILREDAGVDWVVDEVAAIVGDHKPDAVVLDPAGQAASLVAPLGIAKVEVTQTDLKQMVEACAQFADAIQQRRVIHRGDPRLQAAVEGAKTRAVGDGAWAWARRTSSSNITPLVAATLAVWGVKNAGAPVYWVL